MFNKTIIQKGSTEYVPYEKSVTVNEHRAPTDKSVELLKELEEKAKEKILDSAIISDNVLSAAVVLFEKKMLPYGVDIRAKFTLNGKEHYISTFVDRNYWYDLMNDAIKADRQFGKGSELIRDFLIENYSRVISEMLWEQTSHMFLKQVADGIK